MTIVSSTSRVWLKAPPAQVFDYISDLTRHPEWSGGPLKIDALTPGLAAVGSQYRSTGGQAERVNELRVTALDSPSRFAFIATDARMGEIQHEFTFTAQDGGTLMERKVTGSMPPPVALLFRVWLYPRQGKPLMDKALAKLKAKWE